MGRSPDQSVRQVPLKFHLECASSDFEMKQLGIDVSPYASAINFDKTC